MARQDTISFKIPANLAGALDHEARAAGISRAEMARAVIAHTLATDVSGVLQSSQAALQDRSTEQLVDIVRGLTVAVPSALALLASSSSSQARAKAQAMALDLVFAVDWVAYGQTQPDPSDDTTTKVAALKARVAALLDEPDGPLETKTTGGY